jgi:hypothetical protein
MFSRSTEVIYFLVAFSLLLNFFLAIVIDSYAVVMDSVKECVIEYIIFWDVYGVLLYPILRRIKVRTHNGHAKSPEPLLE